MLSIVSLLGTPFLLLVVVVAVFVLGGTWTLWSRWPRLASIPGRLLSLLLVMVMGAVLAATLANRSFDFYSSVDDLLGHAPAQAYEPPAARRQAPSSAAVRVLTPDWHRLVRGNAAAGHGTMLSVLFLGTSSRINRRGLLYLPAVWLREQPLRLPVLELFNGYPGEPSLFQRYLNIGEVVDSEISAHRLPPVLVAIPTVYERRSSECVNAVSGERDETYLAVDVPEDLQRTFHAQTGRSFAGLGYSEGGFCATNLGLHHPDRYAAAASLSGYFRAGEGVRDPRRLYGRGRVARDRNSPQWWVQHRDPTGPPLFLMASTGDPGAVADERAMLTAVRRGARRLVVDATIVRGGGHNFGTWARALPAALDFLGQYLPAPLAPPRTLPRLPS